MPLAGWIGLARAAAGIGVVGIGRGGGTEQGSGRRTITAVHVLLIEGGSLKVLVVGARCVPALGAVVGVHGQVVGRAGDVDLVKALVFVMGVVGPV